MNLIEWMYVLNYIKINKNKNILHELFLNKENEKLWKTIGMCSTQEYEEIAQRHSSKMNLEKEHESGNLYDDFLLFDGEINRFLPSFIFWAHGMGTFLTEILRRKN
jgi:hypothetical protein